MVDDNPMLAESCIFWGRVQRIHNRVFLDAIIKVRKHERLIAKMCTSRHGKSQCPLLHGQVALSVDDNIGAVNPIEDFSEIIGAWTNVKCGQFQDK